MASARKNSRRLKTLRSYGLPIDGDYVMSGIAWANKRPTVRLRDLAREHGEFIADVDAMRFTTRGQRAIIEAISG